MEPKDFQRLPETMRKEMEKTLSFLLAAILVITMFTVTAFAAAFNGSIWTDKPGLLGIGYYCTSARNVSSKYRPRCGEKLKKLRHMHLFWLRFRQFYCGSK